MFDKFSRRATRVIFLARKEAGKRGATAIEAAHLLGALVREDQGEFARMMPNVVRIGHEELRLARPFFSAEAASAILTSLEHGLPPEAKPVPDSIDMPASPPVDRTFNAAMDLVNELHHNRVEPLHLLAAMLGEESTGATDVLKQFGVTREAVIAATRT